MRKLNITQFGAGILAPERQMRPRMPGKAIQLITFGAFALAIAALVVVIWLGPQTGGAGPSH